MERKLLLLRRSWWFAGKPQQLRLVRAAGPVMSLFHFSFPTFLCVVDADAVIFLLNFSYIFIFFFLPHSTFFLSPKGVWFIRAFSGASYISRRDLYVFIISPAFWGLDNRTTDAGWLGPNAGDDLRDRDYWSSPSWLGRFNDDDTCRFLGWLFLPITTISRSDRIQLSTNSDSSDTGSAICVLPLANP